jgi:excisionase family DNA binding protein
MTWDINMRKRKHETPAATPEMLKGRLMLRVQEYADLTGTPLPSVYRYLATGKLPAIRIGGTLRISVAALQQQMQEGTAR